MKSQKQKDGGTHSRNIESMVEGETAEERERERETDRERERKNEKRMRWN
jgi:hypothetical protein